MSTSSTKSRAAISRVTRLARGLALREVLLLSTFAIGLALTVAPALQAAGARNADQICLRNLHQLGQAIHLFAQQQNGRLPGPLHPAINQNITADTNPYFSYRQLSWRLREALGSEFDDRFIQCPVQERANPDENFAEFFELTSRSVAPTHYVLNNHGAIGEQTGASGGQRATDPSYYFGISPYLPDIPSENGPKRISDIPNIDREWMIADAWYRGRTLAGFPEFQQEGPYQSAWSGEALPNFAPHGVVGRTYKFTSSAARAASTVRIRQAKADGVTNTLFFDGHVKSMPSRTYEFLGFELLYGFQGTVNPAMASPPASHSVWNGAWR